MISTSQQGFLDTEKGMEDVLCYVPDEKLQQKIRGYWESKKSGEDKWAQLTRELRKFNSNRGKQAKPAVEEIVLGYLYPRLDVHVTEQRNHLLKSPWVVHPKTGLRPLRPAEGLAVQPGDGPDGAGSRPGIQRLRC